MSLVGEVSRKCSKKQFTIRLAGLLRLFLSNNFWIIFYSQTGKRILLPHSIFYIGWETISQTALFYTISRLLSDQMDTELS